MSSFEFWDELNKIFNAVVAYQEKSIEFNNRFITPWVRLGNVFDKQDRTREAIEAYKKSLEIQPTNAQCWFDLGNSYFKIGEHDEAVLSFQRAIELEPGLGWAYSNLALVNVTRGNPENAVLLYQKSIELLKDDKDKAVSWNRLGNLYRKMNEYELALAAFQCADELDNENGGSKDALAQPLSEETDRLEQQRNETIPSPISLLINNELDPLRDSSELVSDQPEMEIKDAVLDSQEFDASLSETETGSQNAAEMVSDETNSDLDEKIEVPESSENSEPVVEVNIEATPPETDVQLEDSEEEAQPEVDATLPEETGFQLVTEEPIIANQLPEETLNPSLPVMVETMTDTMLVLGTTTETTEIPTIEQTQQAADAEDKTAEYFVPVSAPEETSEESVVPQEAKLEEAESGESGDNKDGFVAVAAPEETNEENIELQKVNLKGDGAGESEADEEKIENESATRGFYEEFLRDDNKIIEALPEEGKTSGEFASTASNASAQIDPVTEIDSLGEVKMEIDVNNARVWNELGNVYYNNGAADDAIIAYSKAIELDRTFAWPYSNLALTYTQKNRLAEAVLLYQRSIELFDNEKDKAIVWNRLGNVYRRMFDYASAISSYQRADELDPDNSSLSMQSRYSLLGSLSAPQLAVQEQG